MCVHAAGNFLYILLEDSTAQIIFYTSTAGDFAIPAELDGHVVSSIGKGVFRKLYKSNITIPDSVTNIGANAFPRSITLTVSRNSYAAQYCEEKGYNYTSPDPNVRLPY